MARRLHAWLVPALVWPLAERFGGRRMWTELQRLRALQWRSLEELEARALNRMQGLVVHAARHVPYYRDLFQHAGVGSGQLHTLADLALFPITTKADLRRDFPGRTTAENLPVHRQRTMMTSGSTGLPFTFFWDRACADALFGAYLFALEWAGTALWDTRIQIASPAYFYTNVMPASRLRQALRRALLGEHTYNLPAHELTAARFRALVESFAPEQRYFMRGYPSSIAHLVAQLGAADPPLPCYPKVVMTYAETLTAANAAHIQERLRCAVVNYYSSWEVPQIAQTCPDYPALLHINTERVWLRVVRPDGTMAPAGEVGRVVVTDLANEVMPLINYSLGDRAAAGGPCPCGRGFPTLASLEGRDTEGLRLPDGRQVSSGVLGQFLAFVLGAIPYIWEYQVVQAALDEVALHVVGTEKFSAEFARTLQEQLAVFLGPDVRVTILPVAQIPLESSGKRLIIKSLLS